jgi:hypothetical protein
MFSSSPFPSPIKGEGGVKGFHGIIIALVYLFQVLKSSFSKDEICLRDGTGEGWYE